MDADEAHHEKLFWPWELNPERLHPPQVRTRLTQFEAGKFARQLLGITQEQAAADIGVSYVTLRRWETGWCLPLPDQWRAYKAWLIKTFVAYATLDNVPRETDLRVGSNVWRQRLGLAGHCARCAEIGHRKAHPGVRCKDVGCTQRHTEEPIPGPCSACGWQPQKLQLTGGVCDECLEKTKNLNQGDTDARNAPADLD